MKEIKRIGMYDLSCRFDMRQSFYSKARVEVFSDNSEILWSYSTPVACFIQNNLL